MPTTSNHHNIFTCVILSVVLMSCVQQERSKPADSAYQWQPEWSLQLGEEILGNPTGIGIDSDGFLFVFHRADRMWVEPFPSDPINKETILKIDPESGAILSSFGAGLFIMPHGLTVDHEDNIWITDVALHQVMKLSPNGNILLTLGEAGVAGADDHHFNLPTDVAIHSDGSIYVSDGYGNSRVMHFTPEGTLINSWGTLGDRPGEFNIPHGIVLDVTGNVYVADRENNRIQKFDGDGNLLELWQNPRASEQLYSVCLDPVRNHVFGIDYVNTDLFKGSDIFRFDTTLTLQSSLGRTGHYSGSIGRYHDIAVDQSGEIYVGDILENRVQKFVPLNTSTE